MRTLMLLSLIALTACYHRDQSIVIPPPPNIKIDLPIHDTSTVAHSGLQFTVHPGQASR